MPSWHLWRRTPRNEPREDEKTESWQMVTVGPYFSIAGMTPAEGLYKSLCRCGADMWGHSLGSGFRMDWQPEDLARQKPLEVHPLILLNMQSAGHSLNQAPWVDLACQISKWLLGNRKEERLHWLAWAKARVRRKSEMGVGRGDKVNENQ